MTDGGSLRNSDLRHTWPRRRAVVWIALCVVLVVGLIGSAASDGDRYVVILAVFPAFEAVRAARRLRRSRTG